MILLKQHFHQLSDVHYSAVNNTLHLEEELAEQVRNCEYILDCIRMDCYRLSNIRNIDLDLLRNYCDMAELMFAEVYSHNLIRIRNLCI